MNFGFLREVLGIICGTIGSVIIPLTIIYSFTLEDASTITNDAHIRGAVVIIYFLIHAFPFLYFLSTIITHKTANSKFNHILLLISGIGISLIVFMLNSVSTSLNDIIDLFFMSLTFGLMLLIGLIIQYLVSGWNFRSNVKDAETSSA